MYRQSLHTNILKSIFLIIPTIRQGGGAARVFLHLLTHLNRTKFRITLIVNRYEDYNMPFIPSDIHVIDLKCIKSRQAIFRIILLCFKYKPDIVLSTMGYMNLLISLFRPLLPRETKFIARETNTVSIKNQYQKYPNLYNIFYNLFYNNLDIIVAQSNHMRYDLIDKYCINPDKIIVINNPVDLKYINLLSHNTKYKSRKNKHLVAVGRFNYQKGYDLLIEAFSILDSSYYINIIGDGDEKDKISRMITEHNLTNRVKLLGYVDNPYSYMKKADLFISSSRYEGFPNAVIEANACGTPVIAFNCPGGTSEIIVEGINGYLSEPENTVMLANSIEKGIDTKFNREQIINMTIDRYNLKSFLHKYEVLF